MRQLRTTSAGRLDDPGLLDDSHLRDVLAILNPEGEETRLVGGAVRNALLGLPPGDIDLATTLPPAEVMRYAKAARLRAIPTGIAHGTVTILAGGQPFEVTTLREDVETDGRHAVVRFGRDFALDARRRDFTMNALSLGPDGTIFDTVGGLEDLARGKVRFIGAAPVRIREDYLRILRFFRFHATYGIGAIDAAGLAAATAQLDGLATLSRERVRAEMLKILGAPGATRVLNTMQASGILACVIPGPVHLDRLGRLVAMSGHDADVTLRLAALALTAEHEVEALRDRLRLTNAETKRLVAALKASADLAATTAGPDRATLTRLLFIHGREACLDASRLHAAAVPVDDAAWRADLAYLTKAAVPVLPFGGADLVRQGLTGPALGSALASLRRRWVEDGFPDDVTRLQALLSEAVDAARDQPSV